MFIVSESSQKYLVLEKGEEVSNLTFKQIRNYFETTYTLEDIGVKNKFKFISKSSSLVNDAQETPEGYAYWLREEFRKQRILEKYDGCMQSITNKKIGDMLWNTGGFLAVTKEWVSKLAQWIGDKKVLELFSGLGVLSCALRQYGVDVVSVDNHSYRPFSKQTSWIEDTIEMDALEAIEKYGKECNLLLCSYPPIDGQMELVLDKMRKSNPSLQMIYLAPFHSEYTGDQFCFKAEVQEDEGLSEVYSLYKDWLDYPRFAADFKLIK